MLQCLGNLLFCPNYWLPDVHVLGFHCVELITCLSILFCVIIISLYTVYNCTSSCQTFTILSCLFFSWRLILTPTNLGALASFDTKILMFTGMCLPWPTQLMVVVVNLRDHVRLSEALSLSLLSLSLSPSSTFVPFSQVFFLLSTFSDCRFLFIHSCDNIVSLQTPTYLPNKFFVGCLPTDPEATTEELREHFIQYGPLSDVYIPKPYRGFGFITFMDGEDGQKMLGFHHSLRGCSLNITVAEPRGIRASQSQLHGYSYSGAASFSLDSRMGSPSEAYAGCTSQYNGCGLGSEYSSLLPEYRSLVGGADSFRQVSTLYDQQPQYTCNGTSAPLS